MRTLYGVRVVDLEAGNYTLDFERYLDAVLYPSPRHSIAKVAQCGIFDSNGVFIESSSLIRKNLVVTDRPEKVSQSDLDSLDIEAIYGGCLIHHFGHFLLESLARIWFAAQNNLPIIWVSGVGIMDYQKKIFELLGINSERMIFVEKPVKIKSLLIPRPGFVIPTAFHPKHAEFLSCFSPQTLKARKVYLSRSSFKSNIATISGEREMEDLLCAAGWEVVSPEKLDILDQLDLIASSQYIAAIEGSAVHSVILCERLAGCLVLLRRKSPNLNYDTIARTKGVNQINIHGEIAPTPSQPKLVDIVNPKRAAHAIMNACD